MSHKRSGSNHNRTTIVGNKPPVVNADPVVAQKAPIEGATTAPSVDIALTTAVSTEVTEVVFEPIAPTDETVKVVEDEVGLVDEVSQSPAAPVELIATDATTEVTAEELSGTSEESAVETVTETSEDKSLVESTSIEGALVETNTAAILDEETPAPIETLEDTLQGYVSGSDVADEETSENTTIESSETSVVVNVPIESNDPTTGATEDDTIDPATDVIDGAANISSDLEVISPVVEEALIDDSEQPIEILLIRDSLREYKRIMGNSYRATERELTEQQVSLHNVMVILFRLRGQSFLAALSEILSFIKANSDFCFKEKYMYRGVQSMNIGEVEQSVFRSVLMLFVKIADPADRPFVRHNINIQAALRHVSDNETIGALINEFLG